MTESDAVDGAHSAASKCYRLVASKPERFKEVSSASITASVQPTKPAAPAATINVLIYISNVLVPLASTNKSLAQINKSPKVAAALVQKMHLDQGTR
jgi:hypothetical protein